MKRDLKQMIIEKVADHLQVLRLHRDETALLGIQTQIMDAKIAVQLELLEAAQAADFSLRDYKEFLEGKVGEYARFEKVAKATAMEAGEGELFLGTVIFDTPIIGVYRLIRASFQEELTWIRNRTGL